jgi:hypothetical protein
MAGPFWLAGNQGRVEGGQQLGRSRLLVDAFAAQMWAGPSLDFANPSLVCGHSKLGVRILMPVERRVDLVRELERSGLSGPRFAMWGREHGTLPPTG